MGEAFIVRKGGVTSEATAAPTITIVSETPTGVTFTLTNNDDNTALITYEIDGDIGGVELAAAATSSNITVALAAGTYTLTAFATVVGEVASSATAAVEIVIPQYELLYDSLTANAGSPITLPTTQIDITGLNIGKDDTLRLVYTLVGSSTANLECNIFVNDQTTTTNYHYQSLTAFGTEFQIIRTTKPFLAFYGSDKKTAGVINMKVSNNDRFVAQNSFMWFIGSQGATSQQRNYNIVGSGFTLTSITKVSIIAETTNSIATGSRIQLYKVTEAA